MKPEHEAQLTNDPLLKPSELAELLGLKSRTIDLWRTTGYGPPHLKIGRVVRYKMSTVREWLDLQVRRSTSDTGDA